MKIRRETKKAEGTENLESPQSPKSPKNPKNPKKEKKNHTSSHELITGNRAAAYAARLCRPDVIPMFPITPQTEIIETLAKWKADGSLDAELLRAESEHSVLSAAVGSSAAGSRTFTATSSQGLLLMHEVLYIASGLRLPIVMVNVSRGLSAPITLWTDFNDVLDQRDAGWIIFFAKDNQETLDTVIQAFRIAEDKKVMVPVIVNMEGFIHSYTREPVVVPSQIRVDSFLPEYKPLFRLDVETPMTFGPGVMKEYMFFKYKLHEALVKSLETIKDVNNDFKKKFGREYDIIETYMLEDADIALITMGSMTNTAQYAVQEARAKGKRVGLIRLRLYRPWPEEDIMKALKGLKGVAVVDRDISPGKGGIIYNDIRGLARGITVNGFIAGLGGKAIRPKDYHYIINATLEDAKTKKSRTEWVM